MAIAGNIIWWLTLGFIQGLAWYFFGALMYLSIIGIPWGRSCFEIGKLCLAPFGKDIVSVKELRQARAHFQEDETLAKRSWGMMIGRGIAGAIWFVPGVILALLHVSHGVFLLLTIIGIPLALQDFKIAGLSLFPLGKRVVTAPMADEVRRAAARHILTRA